MSSRAYLDTIVAEQQILRDVKVLRIDSRDIVAVGMLFDRTTIYFLVNPHDDTLDVSLDEPTVINGARWNVASPTLLAAVGKRMQWYWQMCNTQGYWDAIQIELVDDSLKHDPVCFQMVAIASRLSIRNVIYVE